MKNTQFILILLITSIISFSCKKDDTLRYGNVTMGNLVDGHFVSDQGNTFNVAESTCKVDFEKFRRGIMQCDVLKKVGEKEYDVRVTRLDTVFMKSPIAESIASDDIEKTVEDPIHIEQFWVSGGYVNMYIMFEIQTNPLLENSKHMINLVYDDSSDEEGKYTFTLRHNSFGETFKPAEKEETEVSADSETINWGFAGSYVTFPIADLIPEKSAEVSIKWKSHVIVGNSWTSSIKDNTLQFTYSKDYFEHAPMSVKSRTTVPVK